MAHSIAAPTAQPGPIIERLPGPAPRRPTFEEAIDSDYVRAYRDYLDERGRAEVALQERARAWAESAEGRAALDAQAKRYRQAQEAAHQKRLEQQARAREEAELADIRARHDLPPSWPGRLAEDDAE